MNQIISHRPTIGQTFLDRVRLTPQKVGFLHKVDGDWKEITFKALYEECRDASIGLIRLGVQPGDRVALLSNTRVEWSKADLAILGASAITVPIYPSSTLDEVQFILDHSGARFVFVENAVQLEKVLRIRKEGLSRLESLEKVIVIEAQAMAHLQRFQDLIEWTLSLDALKELGSRADREIAKKFHENLEGAKPNDVFTICYTSGTTGKFKGAILTHENMMSVLNDAVETFGPSIEGRSTRILSFLPFSHILGRVESYATYVFGWRQAFAEDLEKILINMREIQPTVIFAVPRLFEKAYRHTLSLVQEGRFGKKHLFEAGLSAGKQIVANRKKGDFSSPKSLVQYAFADALLFRKLRAHFGGELLFTICGGAPLSPEVGEFFQVAGIKILEGYGLTETCGPIAVNTPEDYRFGSAGKPFPEVQIRIAEDGEILVRSKKVFLGYYQSPQETTESIRDGWLATGDIGSIDDDGYLHITDRKKDLIVTSGGKNVAPQKIEKLAATIPFFSNIVVCGDNRPFIAAIISLNTESTIQFASENQIIYSAFEDLIKHPKIRQMTEKLIGELNEKLPSFERIRKFIIVPEDFSIQSGTMTSTLKIKRNTILRRYATEIGALYQE